MLRKCLSNVKNAASNFFSRPLLSFFLVWLAILSILFVAIDASIANLSGKWLISWISIFPDYAVSLFLLAVSFLLSYAITKSNQPKEQGEANGKTILLVKRIFIVSFFVSFFLLIIIMSFAFSSLLMGDLKRDDKETVSENSSSSEEEIKNSAKDQTERRESELLEYLNSKNYQEYYIEKGPVGESGEGEYYLYEGQGDQKKKVSNIALPITDISKLSGFWYDDTGKRFIVSQYIYERNDEGIEEDYFYAALRGYSIREGENNKWWAFDFDIPFNIERYGHSYSLAGFCPGKNRIVLSDEYGDGSFIAGSLYYKDIDNSGGNVKIGKEGEIEKFGGDLEGGKVLSDYIGFAEGLLFFESYNPIQSEVTNITAINASSLEEEEIADLDKVFPGKKIVNVGISKGEDVLVVKDELGKEYFFDFLSKTLKASE